MLNWLASNILLRLVGLVVLPLLMLLASAVFLLCAFVAIPVVLLLDINIKTKYVHMSDRLSWIPRRNDIELW